MSDVCPDCGLEWDPKMRIHHAGEGDCLVRQLRKVAEDKKVLQKLLVDFIDENRKLDSRLFEAEREAKLAQITAEAAYHRFGEEAGRVTVLERDNERLIGIIADLVDSYDMTQEHLSEMVADTVRGFFAGIDKARAALVDRDVKQDVYGPLLCDICGKDTALSECAKCSQIWGDDDELA